MPLPDYDNLDNPPAAPTGCNPFQKAVQLYGQVVGVYGATTGFEPQRLTPIDGLQPSNATSRGDAMNIAYRKAYHSSASS